MKKTLPQSAFSLVELLVSIFISGILFTALFSFVYQFGEFFRQVVEQRAEMAPADDFIQYLENDLRKTNAVNLREKGSLKELTYMVANVKNTNANRVQGKEVKITYDAKTGSVKLLESWFTWAVRQYIEDNLEKRVPVNNLEKTWQLSPETAFQFSLVFSSPTRQIPVLLRLVQLKKLAGDTLHSKTHLIRLGRI